MKGSFLKIIHTAVWIFFVLPLAKSQDSTVKFYNIISNDSVEMYFNNSYNFTEESCAENRRYTKIDNYGDFYQAFTDRNANGIVTAKGYYSEGVKNGYFETFYPNGQLKSKGNFKDNKPTGDWFYFYPDGKPERQLSINAADTFLIQFYNENDEHTVIDGNGNFKGPVETYDRFFRNTIIASGQVLNGKLHGEWKSFIGQQPYCIEKFDKGNFISGEQSSILSGRKKYSTKSYLSSVYLLSYIESLEQFRVFKCTTFKPDTNTVVSKNKVNTSFSFDKSYVNDAVNRVLEDDMRSGAYKDYMTGENFLKFSFKIKDDGSLTDFKQITGWGDQYYQPVTTALAMHTKLPASTTVKYFQLTIIKSESSTITYKYNFVDE